MHWQPQTQACPCKAHFSALCLSSGSWEPPGTQAREMPHPLGRNRLPVQHAPSLQSKKYTATCCYWYLRAGLFARRHSHSFPYFLLSSRHHTLLHSPQSGEQRGAPTAHPPALAPAPAHTPISGKWEFSPSFFLHFHYLLETTAPETTPLPVSYLHYTWTKGLAIMMLSRWYKITSLLSHMELYNTPIIRTRPPGRCSPD